MSLPPPLPSSVVARAALLHQPLPPSYAPGSPVAFGWADMVAARRSTAAVLLLLLPLLAVSISSTSPSRGGQEQDRSIRNPYTYEKKWLSTFTIAEESACAHDVAAIRYFGSRVKLNFPINASLQTSSRLLLE